MNTKFLKFFTDKKQAKNSWLSSTTSVKFQASKDQILSKSLSCLTLQNFQDDFLSLAKKNLLGVSGSSNNIHICSQSAQSCQTICFGLMILALFDNGPEKNLGVAIMICVHTQKSKYPNGDSFPELDLPKNAFWEFISLQFENVGRQKNIFLEKWHFYRKTLTDSCKIIDFIVLRIFTGSFHIYIRIFNGIAG